MKNSKVLFDDFVRRITLSVDKEEIESIGFLVFESQFHLNRTDLLAAKSVAVSDAQLDWLHGVIARLNQHEPVQYILGEADFYGRKFKVDSNVLIPRPETEELVRMAIDRVKNIKHPKILDIGTGSGCIPITIALEIGGSAVWATDISEGALTTAKTNADAMGATVNFIQHNILQSEIALQALDLVVSNPPYITDHEKNVMEKNVLNYEPHLALFVRDNDPLIFYRAISDKAMSSLKPGGFLGVEINEKFGVEAARLFTAAGFKAVEIIKDLTGKPRVVWGMKSLEGRVSLAR